MITIATLFDENANISTKKIWESLGLACSLSEIQTAPYPHFTWLSALRIKAESIEELIDHFIAKLPYFVAKSSGIGIFTGSEPIIFLPIIKTKLLVEVHERIWKTFSPFAESPNNYYAPDQWIPHITIAMGDVTPEKAACAVRQLVHLNLEMEIPVNNLAILSNIDNNPQIDYKKYFSKDEG